MFFFHQKADDTHRFLAMATAMATWDGSPAAEHDRQAVQGGVDRFRYGPGVPSGVFYVSKCDEE